MLKELMDKSKEFMDLPFVGGAYLDDDEYWEGYVSVRISIKPEYLDKFIEEEEKDRELA